MYHLFKVTFVPASNATNIVSIEKTNNGKWLINNEFLYDLIINTSPLKSLPYAVLNCPLEIKNAASGLKYNKVTTMLWETNETDCTWTYLPSSDSIFHRYIHIGNFFVPKKNYTMTLPKPIITKNFH